MTISNRQLERGAMQDFESRTVSLETFIANPAPYLQLATERRQPVHVVNGGKIVYVIEDGPEHAKWSQGYFEALSKLGELDPVLEEGLKEWQFIKDPHWNA